MESWSRVGSFEIGGMGLLPHMYRSSSILDPPKPSQTPCAKYLVQTHSKHLCETCHSFSLDPSGLEPMARRVFGIASPKSVFCFLGPKVCLRDSGRLREVTPKLLVPSWHSLLISVVFLRNSCYCGMHIMIDQYTRTVRLFGDP